MTEVSNFRMASAVLKMRQPLSAELLIAIGRQFGVKTAAAVYQALSAEPVKDGIVIDWTQIEQAIAGRREG